MGLLLTQHFLPFLICHSNPLWRSLFSTQAEIPESQKCMSVSQCPALQHSHTKRTVRVIAMHQAKYHLMSFLISTFLRSVGTFYDEGLFCSYSKQCHKAMACIPHESRLAMRGALAPCFLKGLPQDSHYRAL